MTVLQWVALPIQIAFGIALSAVAVKLLKALGLA